jgi:pyruvate/2-oxoglutarate dehydrogenase complex dihydrolipoamide acyltransferase (E2) component
MKDIELKNAISVAPELWATSILPEGILERWVFADGRPVEIGDPVAVVRIESALHDILAPTKGHLRIDCNANAVVEPGSVIGYVCREIQGTSTAAPSNDPARKSASA